MQPWNWINFSFLLHCHHYTNTRLTLLNSIAEIIDSTFNIANKCLANLLLFGSPEYTEIENSHIINATIKYLLDSERFNDSPLQLTKRLDFGYIYSWLILGAFLFLTLMLMISTSVQLWYCQVLCMCTFFFLSLYILNVVSKYVYIILIEKKRLNSTVADWESMGRIIRQSRGQVF